ncbi:unnamed protein product [Parnassius apollo]|uniref:(apollo) hypothetical protein n=1 Tax=Parnassius apollo TaxID=110799 RepID=A0A8S3XRT6_PARAO|nr:unnamed protein product [Parnassius apollo]
MATETGQNNNRTRFHKLSLKKNYTKSIEVTKKLNRSSDVIILDESFDRLQSDFTKNVQTQRIYSPIVINDSCELSEGEGLRKIKLSDNEPSKAGNVLFNSSKEEEVFKTTLNESRPSIGGWSPAQNIICATPRHEPLPSTPKDMANESLEQCSIKKIQQSQQKLLSDLYGETWKTIPSLFKTISHKHDNLDGVSKKLYFNDDDDSDKENIKYDLQRNKLLYLTGSDAKHKTNNRLSNTEKKSKKKLYTEKVPNTPEVSKLKPKIIGDVKSTTKKRKGLTVTELVAVMKNDVEVLTKKVENVTITPVNELNIKRLSFLGSLADNVPSWRCHPEAIQYRDNFKTLREQLTRRLYVKFNQVVFNNALDEDMPIIWDTKLRSTAGTTTNRQVKNAKGDRIRTSSIKLSTKVVDAPQRLRDTLIHELCHAATWLIDGELRAGHGPLWKKWATRALQAFPELGEISRCHDLEIYYKYCYKCTKCGYSIKRHSKSIDVTKKCCGYCRGTFEVIVNKKNKDGVVVSTPARKGGLNEFALYVKENYGTLKDGTRTHAQVMKLLGEQFSARKKKPCEDNIVDTDI